MTTVLLTIVAILLVGAMILLAIAPAARYDEGHALVTGQLDEIGAPPMYGVEIAEKPLRTVRREVRQPFRELRQQFARILHVLR